MNGQNEIEPFGEKFPEPAQDGKKKNPVATCACLGCLGIVAGIALLTAAIFFGAFVNGLAEIKKGNESKSWPTTQGKVLSSEIEAHKSTTPRTNSGSGRTTVSYHGIVKYAYAVSGQDFESERISYKSYGGSQEHAKEVVATYPVGSSVTVHYNPANPAESVLEPGVGWASFLAPVLWASPFFILILVAGGVMVRFRKEISVISGRLRR